MVKELNGVVQNRDGKKYFEWHAHQCKQHKEGN